MNEEAPKFVKVITVVLIVVFLVLLVFLVRQYERVRRMHQIDSYKLLINNVRNKAPLGVDDVPIIQSWMTFAYVDTIFNLPPTYLKNSLSLSDTHYPNITIGRYAKNKGMPTNAFVEDVKKSIRDYFESTVGTHTINTSATGTTGISNHSSI